MSYYLNPTFNTIVQNITNEIISQTGTVPLNNSIQNIIGTAIAKEMAYMFGKIDFGFQQINPATMTGTALDAWAKIRGIYRNSAAAATGFVTFTGTADTVIPAGTDLIRSDGTIYTTDAAGTVGGSIAITCQTTGLNGNSAAGTSLYVSPPISGVDTTLTVANDITGGTDTETDAALRKRMYDAFQTVPTGGSSADHINWLDAVPGVIQSWCNPVPSQGNIVTCYVMFADTNGNNGFPTGTSGTATGETRAANATGDLLTVANAVYANKPVGEIMWIAAPIAQPIDITISGLSTLTADIQTQIQTALTTYIRSIATPLGTTIYLTALESVVSNTASTTSFTIETPTANITTNLGYFATLGTITYTT